MSASKIRAKGKPIPPLLEPYVHLPADGELVLLTGVLNATPTWVVSRFVSSALGYGSDAVSSDITSEDGETAVVLVSWMRDWDFWSTELRRGGVRGD